MVETWPWVASLPNGPSLQWGHRLSVVETRMPSTSTRDSRPLQWGSMGPSPFGGGNRVNRPPFADVFDASMGPPPFGGGNVPYVLLHQLTAHPSMGPPPFGGGNYIWQVPGISVYSSLQWGHRLSVVETPPAYCRRRPGLASFNGATAFRWWKRVNSGVIGVGVGYLQ